jgi:MFS family permease
MKQSVDAAKDEPAGNGQLLRHNLSRSMGDAGFFGAMVGVGEAFIPAFALAVGMGETKAGMLASIPVAVGGVMQLASLRMMRLLGTHQRWVVLCASVQAAAFIPLVVGTLLGLMSFEILLLATAVYWAAGLASGPAWNTWMESIVPPGVRAVYFGKRSRFQQAMTFVGLVAGGVLLQFADSGQWKIAGFLLLFVTAAMLRLASVFCLATHRPDGRWQNEGRKQVTNSPVADSRDGAKLLVYLIAMQVFIQVSGPYFAPYMLKVLKLSYAEFVVLLSVAFLFRIGALAMWSRVAKQFGAATLMWIGAVTLIPLSALWAVSQNLVWLGCVQAFSGFAWAAYELGFFLLFFETLPPAKRTQMLTYYNLGNSLAMLAGALIGAAVLNWLQFGPQA